MSWRLWTLVEAFPALHLRLVLLLPLHSPVLSSINHDEGEDEDGVDDYYVDNVDDDDIVLLSFAGFEQTKISRVDLRKSNTFLGHFPKQRTPHTHPMDLGLSRKFTVFPKIS